MLFQKIRLEGVFRPYLKRSFPISYLLHLIIGCSSGGSSSDSSSPISFFFDGSCQFEYFSSAPSFSRFFSESSDFLGFDEFSALLSFASFSKAENSIKVS